MTTLLLHPRFDEDSQLIWQAAVSRGWSVMRAGYDLGLGPDPTLRDELVLYGGAEWGASVAAQMGISLLSLPDDWLINASYDLTKRVSIKQTIRWTRERSAFPVFAKSVTGKQIASRVYHSADDFPPESDDIEVLAQPPLQWMREYRAFVLDGEVRALSMYADNGQLRVEPWGFGHSGTREAATFAYESVRLAENLPRAFVLDVGELYGRDWFDRWAVVEPNPAWCSGLYACDPDKALDVIAASCGVRA